MRYLWGLLLVMLGVGYLGASLGWIDYNAVNQIWSWWPLILVFIGLDILTRRLKYGWVIMIIFTLVAGFLIYDISFAPDSSVGLTRDLKPASEKKTTTVDLSSKEDYERAELELDTGAMELAISEVTDKLLEGALTSSFSELRTDFIERDRTAAVKLSTVNLRGRQPWLGGNLENKLRLKLNKDLPYNLKINSGASDLNLDLSEYLLSGLKVSAGASSIDIKLGDRTENNAELNFETGASEIVVKIPKGLGARIQSKSGLSSADFVGFVKVDDEHFENSSYAKAAKKINIVFNTGASSIRVEEY